MNVKIIASLALCLVALFPDNVLADKAKIVFYKIGCQSYYIAENSMGFYLLEWFGGMSPSKGDIIVGKITSYGMQDIYNITQDTEIKMYVDDYHLSKSAAIEKYMEKC